VYTFRATPSDSASTYEVALGANPTAAAANLAAAINRYEAGVLVATSAAAVVTIRSVADGTAGNSYTTVGGTNVTAGAATLAGGTATGGIKVSSSTSGGKLVVVWYNKR
jgi:hypothetical protein